VGTAADDNAAGLAPADGGAPTGGAALAVVGTAVADAVTRGVMGALRVFEVDREVAVAEGTADGAADADTDGASTECATSADEAVVSLAVNVFTVEISFSLWYHPAAANPIVPKAKRIAHVLLRRPARLVEAHVLPVR